MPLTELESVYLAPDGSILRKNPDGRSYNVIGPTFANTLGNRLLDFAWGTHTIAAGASTCTVAHGLASTPSLIMITPAVAATHAWSADINASSTVFGVKRDDAGGKVSFYWLAGR